MLGEVFLLNLYKSEHIEVIVKVVWVSCGVCSGCSHGREKTKPLLQYDPLSRKFIIWREARCIYLSKESL